MYTRNAVVVLFAPGRFAIQVWADLEFRATTLIGQMLAQLMDKQDIFVSTSQQLLQPGGFGSLQADCWCPLDNVADVNFVRRGVGGAHRRRKR